MQEEQRSMGICGTGTIGACLATLMAGNGIDTRVVGHSARGMERCMAQVRENFRFLEENGKLTCRQVDACLSRLTVSGDYGILEPCGFVMEAVAEQEDIKREVYDRIEAVVSEETILASSTSALLPDALGCLLKHPERFLVAHPFQPAHLQPLVEVVAGARTSPETVRRTVEILEGRLHRRVVTMQKGMPGFIVNRIAQAMFRECISLMECGAADAENIDRAVRYAVGMRYASIGLLEYFDDVGFELEKNIAQSVYPSLCGTDKVQPSVEAGIRTGRTGLRAGQGLYRWDRERIDAYQIRKTRPLLELFDWSVPEE